jgi:hypothetical protein
MRTVVNRLLLGLIGLVLLGVGLAVLARGIAEPDAVLLGASTRRRYREESWWWPTVIAVLAVVIVAALWWLLAQARDRRVRRLVVDEGVVLRGRALADIVAAEAETLPGVARAHAALTVPRDAPTARLVLALAPHADPGAVLAGLETHVLDRARTSAGLTALPAEVRLRAVHRRAARVT